MKHWVLVVAIGVGLTGCQTGGANTPPPPRSQPATPVASQATQPNPTNASATAQPTASQAQPDPQPEIIARLGHIEIPSERLIEPLIEAYGLDFLLQLATLELAIATAEQNNITITEQDVVDEVEHTLANMFQEAPKEDYERLLEQFLAQQKLSRQQFDLVMRTNAWLRAMVEPMVEEKITEESLRQAFGALYGETVRVRHIQLANMQEIAIAQRRLAEGESFEKVAREQSRNARTAPLGGELPPFSRQMQGLPESFKEAAFALSEGEISDAVYSDGAYHLIKLEERIPPKAVEFEDHRDVVREQLAESMTTQGMKQLRNQLAQEAMRVIDIKHPALRKQFQDRLRASQLESAEREEILRDLELQRQRLLQGTSPSTNPADIPPADASETGASENPAADADAPQADAPAAEAATTQPAPVEANK